MEWLNISPQYVEIHTSFDASQEVQDSLVHTLMEYQKGWPKRDLSIWGSEASGTETLLSHIWVASHKERDGVYHTLLEFSLRKWEGLENLTNRRRKNLESKAPSIRKALKEVCALSIQSDVHCTVSWRFATEAVSSVVQLPLLSLDIPGTAFGRVTGVRFSPSAGDPHEYVALDLIGEKELYLASHFVLSSNLLPDILETALERGGHLKDAFVKQREASAEAG